MINKIDLRRWLAIGVLVLLTSAASVAKPDNGKKKGCDPRDKRCASVPDGGSAIPYFFLAGTACLGAVVVRRRLNKTRLS